MNELRRVSPVLLISWFIVAVFVASRVPLMSQAIRHGWYEDVNGRYQILVSVRAFVQEGGRTPYFLFPRYSARPDGEGSWFLYSSWPPLPFYALTPIAALSRDPHVQMFWARLLATLIMGAGSWLVFCLFRTLTQDNGLALIAQVVSTFEIHYYYFADVLWGSQYGYALGLLQTLQILAVVRGVSSKRQVWIVHLVSAVAALTWWANSLIPLTALAMSYVFGTRPPARRVLWGVALSSTLVTIGTFGWLALAELTTTGPLRGTGAMGDGVRVLTNLLGTWWGVVTRFGPWNIGQTYLEFILRFVVPPFPFLASGVSVGQQLTALSLMPRFGFTIDQVVTFPLAVLLFSIFGLLAVRGTRRWLARCSSGEAPQIARFGLLLFAVPGLVFVALLPSWTYPHHSYSRIGVTPIGVVLAVGAYHEVAQYLRRNRTLVLAGWLTIWAASGMSMTYSLVRTFDDSYNRAELAALDWFRNHVRPGSVLLNNIPAYDGLNSLFALFFADGRAYSWWGWPAKVAFPDGFIGFPRPDQVIPYLDRVSSDLSALAARMESSTIQRTQSHVQALREAVGKIGPRPETDGERQTLLDLYGEVFADLRSLNRELRERGLPQVSLPLPAGWARRDNYLLIREDFGLPPLFRGINYSVVFESEYGTAHGAFLGARTAYNLICHEEVRRQRVPIRCRHAIRRATAAVLRGDWQDIRSLSFITRQPSYDNFEFPVRRGAGSTGKMLLIKLEGG